MRAMNRVSRLFLLPIFLLCVASSFALADDSGLAQDAIVRGSEVQSGDPVEAHTVRLHINGMLCTGTLIAPDIIVTAAHCFKGTPKAESIEVGFGIDADSATRSAQAYGIHPAYKGQGAYDIALIQLSGSLPRGFSPAERIGDITRLKRGQQFIVAGYGRTDPKRPATGFALSKGIVKLLSHNSIEFLLASSKEGSSCEGDSGGPSFLQANGKLLLAGVISRGDKDCEIDEVHARVDAHKTWIETTIRELRDGGAND